MEKLSNKKVAIGVGTALSLGILAWVGWRSWGWFGGKKVSNTQGLEGVAVPNTFYGVQCGGVAPTMRVKWYKDAGKYYSIVELLPNSPFKDRPAPTASEVSEETYRMAYKQLKDGCGDVNLPRMENEDPSFALGGKAPVKQKSMDFHGQGGWIDGNKTLTFIGYKPSIFSIGETVNVDFRLGPSTPVVKTITAKVIAIPSPNKSFIVIDSPHETIYNKAYGRVYTT